MKYRPEIDGLRSVAVLPVILFHGGLGLFSGGFVGVDVFFVISGFLITTIILQKIDEGRFSLLDFYARRARRILPALILVVLCTTPFAWIWMLPTEFKDYAQSVAAVGLFSSNFLFWIESGYFAAAAEQKPLLHTWSLAVEEQYYILFPLMMMALWARLPKATTILLAAIFVVSLALAEVMWRVAPDANFYLLPTRAWELMTGSLCAIFVLKRGVQSNNLASGIGLLAITVSIFAFDAHTPFPSLYALAPVIGTGLVLVYGTKGTWVADVLSMRAPVFVGLISYSAYLWHQPLFALARLRDPQEPELVLMMGLAGLSLGLAYLSWRFVEQPARHIPWAAWKTVSAAGLVSIVALGVGATLSVMPWQAQSFRANLAPQNLALLERINTMRRMEHKFTPADEDGACRFMVRPDDPQSITRFETCAAEHGPALLVIGDSHSEDVFKALLAGSDAPFLLAMGQGQCRPHVAGSDCTTTPMPLFLTAQKDRIARIYFAQAGFWLLERADGAKPDRNLFTAAGKIDGQLDVPAIERALDVLTRFDALAPVTWVGPRLEPHVSFDAMLALPCDEAPDVLHLRPTHQALFETLDAHLKTASQMRGIDYVSTMEAVAFDMAHELYSCEALYWSDGDHWSPQGEALFGPRLARGVGL
ncbi:peptidoglycan/LPS O-acetylase OafA/YrhL [Litoreibacter meonggei]|uniref:Peptidoglycan/LPS O-acetylase OafA/YrhL n=1 Tax=Litoreibacter meonggei TaxID=1049199 RepID=A0A497VB89_9RHOB|nr:acyltransferase family protein [Litoreibacter meonggei]RLJ36214.1 peptidoglycan/LPS O-acetylase OafA/YrhL [Litoreibacter meonggei]